MTDRSVPRPPADPEAVLERAIDDVLIASFPASDPPQWDSLAARSRSVDHSTTGSSSQTPISSKR